MAGRIVLAAVLGGAGAIDWCGKPTGGAIPLIYSGCVSGTDKCFNWMNAKCEDGWCTCKFDECIIDGQCVKKGECAKVTGGTCAVQGCDRWRNATCSEKELNNHEAHCVCGPGTCPIKGECRRPGDCAKDTGGTCSALGCNDWRKAKCSVDGAPGPTEKAKCMCDEGSCPMNGECVKKGGCPRYAGSSCSIYKATGFLPCPAGECSEAAYCECPEGECFVDGSCVKASNATIELSARWAQQQEEEAEARQESREASRAVGIATVAFVSAVLGALALKKVSRAQAAEMPPSGYERMAA